MIKYFTQLFGIIFFIKSSICQVYTDSHGIAKSIDSLKIHYFKKGKENYNLPYNILKDSSFMNNDILVLQNKYNFNIKKKLEYGIELLFTELSLRVFEFKFLNSTIAIEFVKHLDRKNYWINKTNLYYKRKNSTIKLVLSNNINTENIIALIE